MGNQRPCGPTMRAVQQGLLAGAAPPGELSLSFSLVLCLHALALSLAHSSLFRGPWVSLGPGGAKLRRESLRGPYRRCEGAANLGGWSSRQMEGERGSNLYLGCLHL